MFACLVNLPRLYNPFIPTQFSIKLSAQISFFSFANLVFLRPLSSFLPFLLGCTKRLAYRGILAMKSNMAMFATLLCLLLIAFIPSGEARLLESDVLIGLGNPSAFDAGLNSAVTDAGSAALTDPAKKTGLPCDEGEMKPWSASAQNATDDKNLLTFRFKENRTGADAKKESPKADEAVYNVLPKGPTAPSEPSLRGNSNINGQGLSVSHHSPGVGHMQVYDIAKSRQSGGAGHMQQEKDGSKKRILGSTPSKGGGH